MKKSELEKKILEEYMKEKDLICGCEEISFEDYKKYYLATKKKK
ncbi:hypothetical protein [Sneathia sanguinegens]|jgi:hypothetical protein|uniref:Uncharacterized protein n=1 Tax=Sneathia sanguinegens TaxID=40543 RepID=A0ABT7HL18_9FUSO|nr:hypothetical protein [Sneathia sanguinegens]MDK9581228.1 hypothetical protein [Sneathia sanguinegens]MDU4652181.1 hypothetical protein [Sneathia sanguinegens]MDU7496617.1 hypothetical protein [Sneathia sanguinegens]